MDRLEDFGVSDTIAAADKCCASCSLAIAVGFTPTSTKRWSEPAQGEVSQ